MIRAEALLREELFGQGPQVDFLRENGVLVVSYDMSKADLAQMAKFMEAVNPIFQKYQLKLSYAKKQLKIKMDNIDYQVLSFVNYRFFFKFYKYCWGS